MHRDTGTIVLREVGGAGAGQLLTLSGVPDGPTELIQMEDADAGKVRFRNVHCDGTHNVVELCNLPENPQPGDVIDLMTQGQPPTNARFRNTPAVGWGERTELRGIEEIAGFEIELSRHGLLLDRQKGDLGLNEHARFEKPENTERCRFAMLAA